MKQAFNILVTLFVALAITDGAAIAKDKKSAPAKKSGGGKAAGREKIIVREAQARKADKTKIDFEDTEIGGEHKAPAVSPINQNKADKNYDLIKIRLRWHPEMIQSTASLEAGR